MFESKSGVFLVGGIGMFALAFLSNALVPWLMYAHLGEKTTEQMIEEQKPRPFNILTVFNQLREEYPDQVKKYITDGKDIDFVKDPNGVKIAADTLRYGRKVYVGEACWHCHSQFVRPVSNESKRYGPVANSKEFANELQRPVLFGTRRVGPDLSREGGRRSNDWHATHFFKPPWTSPGTVMPEYPWFFDGDPGKPNHRGLALILYMQFQSSWLETYPYSPIAEENR